MVGIKPQHKH